MATVPVTDEPQARGGRGRPEPDRVQGARPTEAPRDRGGWKPTQGARSSMSMILLVAVILLAAYLLFPRGDVTPEEAHRLVAGGALLLDVRSREEFAAGHLEGAINVPVQELDRRMAELGAKDRPIVLYCRSGARSGHAKKLLESAGFSGARNLGGMSRW